MDHLPTIEDPAYPWPKVPCLCRVEDYDSKGMIEFPERAGWKIDRQLGPVRTSGEVASREAQGGFIQAWLFFGLIADFFEICEHKVDMHDFVWQEDDQSFVTTVLLKGHLDTLARRDDFLKPEICHQRQGRIYKCLVTVERFFFNWNGTLGDKWSVSSVLPTDVILSILILGETIKNAVMELWLVPFGDTFSTYSNVVKGQNSLGQKFSEFPIKFVYFVQRQNPLSQRFSREGWCRSEVSMLTKVMDNTGLFLASMLKLPSTHKLNHESCSELQCRALQITEDNYRTIHADGCPSDASCMEVFIDQEKICSILRSGGIPMIYVPFDPEHGVDPKVRIIDYNANALEYVAISHVWAHDLGNPKANALPSCQILQLKRLTAQLVRSSTRRVAQPAFWIDTLCIPVDPAKKEFRKLAITKLATTFSHARHVLVLDADLQRSSKWCSRTELATRILCSGWMKRLWTLQEAVMTENTPDCSKLDIQFVEGPMEFNAIAGPSVRSLHNTESALNVIYTAFPQLRAKDRMYAFLSRALEYRTTSKPEDEAVCLASIMGIRNLKSIVDGATAEQRMQAMYALIGEIPASVLFHRSKRLEAGFRWAPASLLGNNRNYSFSGPSAKCDSEGLHVQFAGYVVTRHTTQDPKEPFQGRYYIGDLQETEPRRCMGPQPDTERSDHRAILNNDYEFDKIMRETTTPGLIVNPYDAIESALVSVIGERKGVIYGIFLKKAYIRKPSSTTKSYQHWKKHFIETREVSSDQRWCIR